MSLVRLVLYYVQTINLLLLLLLFSILLFYSTVCFHFAEQINDDDDDDEVTASWLLIHDEIVKVVLYVPLRLSPNPPLLLPDYYSNSSELTTALVKLQFSVNPLLNG